MFQPINATIDRFNRVWAVDYGTNSVKVFALSDLTKELFSFGSNLFNFNEKTHSFPDIAILNSDKVVVENELCVEVADTNTVKTFNIQLLNKNISGSDLVLTDGVETFTFGNDVLVGSEGGSGTFNETDGTVAITFNTAPIANILADYKHYNNDKIFVSDTYNHTVRVFNYSLNLIKSIGSFGHENGNLYTPCGIALNSDNSELHVVEKDNHRISVFNTTNYAFKQTYGKKEHSNSQGLYFPTDIVFTTTKALVTDTGNNRVVSFVLDTIWKEASTYVVKSFTTSNTSKVIGVFGIVSNESRTGIHLTDVYASLITNYTDAFEDKVNVINKGKTSDKVLYPKGLVFSGSSNLIVSDTGNFRINNINLT